MFLTLFCAPIDLLPCRKICQRIVQSLNILNVIYIIIYIEKDKENVCINITNGINHLITR